MVNSEVKVTVCVVIFSITLISVMVVFGSINFFEEMSCEKLKTYVSDMPVGKYPFGSWMTPSQVESLHEQYNNQCG
jgi:hypothetical protein